jgi:hypothetical protein
MAEVYSQTAPLAREKKPLFQVCWGNRRDDETVQRRAGNLNPKPDLESDRAYEERHAHILIVARSPLHLKAGYICADYSYSKKTLAGRVADDTFWVSTEDQGQ